jgi:hypothetical protein
MRVVRPRFSKEKSYARLRKQCEAKGKTKMKIPRNIVGVKTMRTNKRVWLYDLDHHSWVNVDPDLANQLLGTSAFVTAEHYRSFVRDNADAYEHDEMYERFVDDDWTVNDLMNDQDVELIGKKRRITSSEFWQSLERIRRRKPPCRRRPQRPLRRLVLPLSLLLLPPPPPNRSPVKIVNALKGGLRKR